MIALFPKIKMFYFSVISACSLSIKIGQKCYFTTFLVIFSSVPRFVRKQKDSYNKEITKERCKIYISFAFA